MSFVQSKKYNAFQKYLTRQQKQPYDETRNYESCLAAETKTIPRCTSKIQGYTIFDSK